MISDVDQLAKVVISFRVASYLVGVKTAHLLCGADNDTCCLIDVLDVLLDYRFVDEMLTPSITNLEDYEKEER